VNWGKVNATLPKGKDPASVTLEEALALITEKAGSSKGKKAPARKSAASTEKKAAAKKPAAKKAPAKAKAPSKAKKAAAAEE
jgi:DNA topoisomerase-1